MPQIQFGTTVAQREEEQAAKIREMEAEIQAHDLRKQNLLSEYQRKTRRAKTIITIVATLLAIALLVFGTYNTFFKKEKSDEEIINLIMNTPLVDNLYPDGGVEGYLKQNITNILTGYITPDSNAGIESVSIDINSLYVTDIVHRDYQKSDVSFSVNIVSKEVDKEDIDGNVVRGESHSNQYNFMIPITYDYGSRTYVLAGKPEIDLSPVVGVASERETSNYYVFDNISELDGTLSDSARLFLDTFLRNLYNSNNDISSASDVSRAALDVSGKTFVAITDFHIYNGTNALGHNSYCDYTISTDGGFLYNNRTYFILDRLDSNTWKIRGVN